VTTFVVCVRTEVRVSVGGGAFGEPEPQATHLCNKYAFAEQPRVRVTRIKQVRTLTAHFDRWRVGIADSSGNCVGSRENDYGTSTECSEADELLDELTFDLPDHCPGHILIRRKEGGVGGAAPAIVAGGLPDLLHEQYLQISAQEMDGSYEYKVTLKGPAGQVVSPELHLDGLEPIKLNETRTLTGEYSGFLRSGDRPGTAQIIVQTRVNSASFHVEIVPGTLLLARPPTRAKLVFSACTTGAWYGHTRGALPRTPGFFACERPAAGVKKKPGWIAPPRLRNRSHGGARGASLRCPILRRKLESLALPVTVTRLV
jgi:hypothetical protein